jgi:hypothetical protein
MNGLMKWTILIVFLIVCIPPVCAISVSPLTIDPSGSLTPGNPVSVSFKVETSGEFPQAGEIRLFTDLEKSQWTYTIFVNDVEVLRAPTEAGHTLPITGFLLRYKPNDAVSLRVTLEGVAPAVTQTSNKILIRITEWDGSGRPITSTQVEKTAIVINTEEVGSTIALAGADLDVYRTHIDEKAVIGIDTSAAEAKYNEAKQKIDSARSRPSNQYAAALSDLSAATTAIADGEKALDKAWAENEVAAAQVPINNVDAIITWFKGNTSTANDQQLPTIITKREVAVSYLSNANDDISDGNYAQARVKAQDAFTKGNESYTEALARQKQLMAGWSIPFPKINSTVIIVVGIVAVVLVVVGVIIYRKRSQWDELG